MSQSSTPFPFSPPAVLTLGSRTFSVRELAWPEAMEFLRKLGTAAACFVTPDGRPRPISDLLPEVLAQGENAIAYLLQQSIGLGPDDLRQLPASVTLRLTQSALELTLNDDLIVAGNAVAERLRRAFGRSISSAAPSISSSGADTAIRM